MNTQDLIKKSILKHKPFYRLIALAVVVAVAVITGSLAVGDSVRSTLVKRVEERLGNTQTIIFSRYSFMDNTVGENGFLLTNGFVSVSGKMIPVMVWGTDNMEIGMGKTKINRALYNEITPSQAPQIVLRLPSAGMVPMGSMYVTDTYTTSLRLELDSVVSVEQGGNLNLKNEQIIPFNIFVNREELAEILDVPGKINYILSDRMISPDDFALVWDYACSGLKVKVGENQVTTVTSERIFIQDKVIETLCQSEPISNRIYGYLANSIGEIPYSFITAVDSYNGYTLDPDEIILSDYAAQRLKVGHKDTLTVSYFVSQQFKTLTVDSVTLRVTKIVPLSDLHTHPYLKADFPGLSNVERCTDWDSDLPINMNLITDEDEAYWTTYKNTPKALVPYSTLAPRWKNPFGSATALQINNLDRLENLTYEMFDIQLIYPREAGFTAAKSGVDFSSLFLSLGIFIIISAAMLMMVPPSEMLFRRRDEINLLKATGFPRKRIVQLLWRESAPVAGLSAIIGVFVGLIYTFLVLFLLGTVWKGATHTDGFKVYIHLSTLLIGGFSGIILSLILLYFRIVRKINFGL